MTMLSYLLASQHTCQETILHYLVNNSFQSKIRVEKTGGDTILLPLSQIVGLLFHFRMSQNVVFFQKSINKISIFPINLFKKINTIIFYRV